MTDFWLWLPAGFVGVALLLLLAIARWPDEASVKPEPEPEPEPERVAPPDSLGIGPVRLAMLARIDGGVVLDGIFDKLSVLGPKGAPITFVVSDATMDDALYRQLESWTRADAVVDVAIPVGGPPGRVVDLRRGDSEVRLPILGLSS